MKKLYFAVLPFILGLSLSAQPVIYKDVQTLITGTWSGAGAGGTATFAEVTGQTPFEGTKHYRFDYNFVQWWAGVGLNMDNWGASTARNFSGFSHLRIAYRGLSAGQTITITLRNGSNYGNTVEVGTSNSTYAVVDIPIISLTAGSPVIAAAVREIDLSISSPAQAGNGIVFFDALELVTVAGGPAPASAATNARAASLGLGVNTSNWLEAYWLIPFNAYPEFNRYNRTKVRDLHNAGFNTFRLPVTFERLGSLTPPYNLDFGHVAFDLVDSMILWAGIYNFKLIIDNHHGYPLTDANYNTELPRLQAVWEQLTDHYDYLAPSQFFLEIYNEPTNEISNGNWRTVAASLINVIRATETQTHSVLVGANQWNSGNTLVGFTPLADPDIIYTFHNYDPYFFTHQGMSWTNPPNFPPRTFPLAGEVASINQLFTSVKAWSDNYDVPVNLGEFGCSTQADATSRCNWIQTFSTAINTNGFSAFYWDAISPSDAFGFYTNGIINESNCIPCFKTALGLYASLPIALTSLTSGCEGTFPSLTWRAFTTGAGYLFDMERSADGVNWKTVHRLNALEGDHIYQQIDNQSEDARFYRLKMITPDQKVACSPLQEMNCRKVAVEIQVYPNPTYYQTTIALKGDDASLTNVDIYDVAGRIVYTKQYSPAAGIITDVIDIQQFPDGLYFVTAEISGGYTITHQIAVMR